jgi:hypothetical protein
MNSSSSKKTQKYLPLIIVGILIIGIIPFLIAWWLTPSGKIFGGALINQDDMSVYLSAIRQGIEGKWLFNFTFSPESLQPRFTYPVYMLLGQLIGIVGGDPLIWFHGFRVIGGLFSILALFYLARVVFRGKEASQSTALFLLAFGSGIGWMLTPIIPVDSLLLADINYPEWNLVTSLLNSPHFVLGIGLEALFVGAFIQMEHRETWKKAILIGIFSAIGIGLDHPFLIPTLGMVTGIYMVWLAFREKQIPWKRWLVALLIVTPFLLYLLYYGMVALSDPLWETSHIQNNVIEPPPPLGLLIGSGLLGLFALLGIKAWFRQNRTPLIPIWAVVNSLMIYFPVPFSGRFILGLFIPITTLAAFSLEEVILPALKRSTFFTRFSNLTPTPYETLRRIVIILTLPSTLLVTLWVIRNAAANQDFPFYYPAEEIQAAEWLAKNTDEDGIILAYYPLGNYLPREIPGKVFLGHLNLSIDLEDKLEDIETFWDVDTPQEWRDGFLSSWKITTVYQGKYENALSDTSITPPGQVVFQNDLVTIYSLP